MGPRIHQPERRSAQKDVIASLGAAEPPFFFSGGAPRTSSAEVGRTAHDPAHRARRSTGRRRRTPPSARPALCLRPAFPNGETPKIMFGRLWLPATPTPPLPVLSPELVEGSKERDEGEGRRDLSRFSRETNIRRRPNADLQRPRCEGHTGVEGGRSGSR
jgi:hypothetical protein